MRGVFDRRGMSLIEVIVVIAILTILFAIGVFMSMQGFQNYSRRSERDVIVSIFERARSRALANVDQHRWGVCYETGTKSYVVFAGAYASAYSKDTIAANSGVTLSYSGSPIFDCAQGGIAFSQVAATTTAATITVTEGAITSTITTNIEGRIDW